MYQSLADFAYEIVGSTKFFIDRMRGKTGANRPRVTVTDSQGKLRNRMNFEEAFGFSDGYSKSTNPGPSTQMRGSYDENIRLAPYTYGGNGRRRATSSEDVMSTNSQNPSAEVVYAHPAPPKNTGMPA